MAGGITPLRTVGGWAILLALGAFALVAMGAGFSGSMGLFVPLIPPWTLGYWLLASTSVGCAALAIGRRQWRAGAIALALVAVSLLPTAMLSYECARGNCL